MTMKSCSSFISICTNKSYKLWKVSHIDITYLSQSDLLQTVCISWANSGKIELPSTYLIENQTLVTNSGTSFELKKDTNIIEFLSTLINLLSFSTPAHLCLRGCVDEMTAFLGSPPCPRRLGNRSLTSGGWRLLTEYLLQYLLLPLLLLSVSCDPELLTTADWGSGQQVSQSDAGHENLPSVFLLTPNISMIPFLTFGILNRE